MRFSAIVACMIISNAASATVTVITDKQQWQNAAQSHTAITFLGFPAFTIITDQYSDLGITFTDGNDFIRVSGSYSDGGGLASIDGANLGAVHTAFDAPMFAFGLEFLDSTELLLYNDGQLVFQSQAYLAGFTPFVGLISTSPFDVVVVRDDNDNLMTIDNIYFGPPVPAPGVLLILLLGIGVIRSRKR